MPDRICRVVDNVFQIRGTCSSYVIVDGDAALVIAPGDGDWWDELAQIGVKRLDWVLLTHCLLYTSPSPRDGLLSRMPSSA